MTGQPPQQRTFHKAVIAQNVMYIVGGFDGSRLNDMYNIAFEKIQDNSDSDTSSICSHRTFIRPPTSAASGIMQTVPSDLSVQGATPAISDAASDIADECEDNLIKWNDNRFLRKKIKMLQN